MSSTTNGSGGASYGRSAMSGGGGGRASVPGGGRASVPGGRMSAPGRATAGRATAGAGAPPRASGGSGGPPLPPRGTRSGGVGGPGGPRRVKPKWGRIALVAGVIVIIAGLIAGFSLWNYASNLDDDLKRISTFDDINGNRPVKEVDGALNILLVGTDSRNPDAATDAQSEWRADTMIIMHIPADHKSAQLVSIPRDLWVPIPVSNDATCDNANRGKINAAFAFGGVPRAVKTVECMTDVHIDHVATIDFGGFKEVTDALGGVDLKVEQNTKSIHKPYREFTKGTMHMDGATALDWIRQRKQFPRGDFARMQHQQDFLKALMDKAASTGTLTNPGKLDTFLTSVTAAVTVDENFSLTDTALQFRNLRSENLTFITSPNSGSETINGESVVVSDREKALALYEAMAADKMDEWMTANKADSGSGG